MALHYYLQPNSFSENPKDCKARVVVNRSLDEDALIEEIAKLGTTLGKADARAFMTAFTSVVCHELAEGNSINLEILQMRAGIKGKFTDVSDVFDASRHARTIQFRAGKLLQKAVDKADISKVNRELPCPRLFQFNDVVSNTIDSKITPGGIASIKGNALSFDRTNTEEGIFLIDADGKAHAVSTIASITKGTLVFSNPPTLLSGTYKLQVRKHFGKSRPKLRTGEFNAKLTVE
jgi:nucleoid DNA-binding protein